MEEKQRLASVEQLLNRDLERRIIEADIPGVGVMRFRSMDGRERVRVGELCSGKHQDAVMAVWVAFSWVNENGSLICTESDIPAINGMDSVKLEQMFEVVQEHCTNTTPVAVMVEMAKKNSNGEAGNGCTLTLSGTNSASVPTNTYD